MKVVRVIGPSDAGKTTFVERLTDRLADRGPVGTVKHLTCEPAIDTAGKDTARHRAAGAIETYGLGAEGWFATGRDRTLTDALDRLAVDCEYAVVEGFGAATLPTVALGGADAEDVLAAGERADDIDLEAVLAAVESVEPYETLESLVAAIKTADGTDRAGAIATFTGRVRRKDHPDDPPTEYLEFERYDAVADERTAAIRAALTDREGVQAVRLHHRTGVLEAGEDIVFVVVLAGHREAAFAAVEDGIDRLKAEVPLFKKEVTVEGEFWAHEGDGCEH